MVPFMSSKLDHFLFSFSFFHSCVTERITRNTYFSGSSLNRLINTYHFSLQVCFGFNLDLPILEQRICGQGTPYLCILYGWNLPNNISSLTYTLQVIENVKMFLNYVTKWWIGGETKTFCLIFNGVFGLQCANFKVAKFDVN
jgi:hypothetical protein